MRLKNFTAVAFISMLVLVSAYAADNMKAFPPAGEGMARYVINLPEQADETSFKVELVIGKTVKTDAVNRYFFGGALENENIPGWGFNFYILRKLGPMAGTLMAVDPDAPQVERFITLGGEAQLLRYNSRLPLVVYVPAGVEVRYRLWRAETAPRFVQKIDLPAGQTAVVADGDFEARSTGSYSIRIYSTESVQAGDDTTFFSSGVVRARDGVVEKVSLADLGNGRESSLIVVFRSAGSGGYLSADAFTIGKGTVAPCMSVSGLPPDADPVAALKDSLQRSVQQIK